MIFFPRVVGVLVFLSSILLSSPIEEFQLKIEDFFESFEESKVVVSTYSNRGGSMKYEGTVISPQQSVPLWRTIKTFDNVEHNSSQKELKNEFTKLIPDYFRAGNLFSKEECQKAEVSKHGLSLKYNNFFRILYLYNDYLKAHPTRGNKEQYRHILDVSLNNFYSLMRNSDNLIDYIFSVSNLKKILFQVKVEDRLEDVIVNYPPPKEDILFKKLNFEKERTLSMLREMDMKITDEIDFSEKRMKLFKEKLIGSFEKILNEAYRLEEIAIRENSPESLENYINYIKSMTDMKNFNSLSVFVQYKIDIYFIKILDFFGIESNFSSMVDDVTLNLLSSIVLPMGREITINTYQYHKEIIKRQKELL